MLNTEEKKTETPKKSLYSLYFPMAALAGMCLAVAGIWYVGFSAGSNRASSADNHFAAGGGKQKGFSWGGASNWAKDFISTNFPWAASSSWADRGDGSSGQGHADKSALEGRQPGDIDIDRGHIGQASARYGEASGNNPGYGGPIESGSSGGAGSSAGGGGAGDYSASAGMRRAGGTGERGGGYGRGMGAAPHTGTGGLYGSQQKTSYRGSEDESGEDASGYKKTSAVGLDAKKKGTDEGRKGRVAFKDEIREVYDKTARPGKMIAGSLLHRTISDLQAQQNLNAVYAVPRAQQRAEWTKQNIEKQIASSNALKDRYKLPLETRELFAFKTKIDSKIKSLDELKRSGNESRELTQGFISRLEKSGFTANLTDLKNDSAKTHSSLTESFKEYAAKEKELIALHAELDKMTLNDRHMIAGEAKIHIDKAAVFQASYDKYEARRNQLADNDIPFLNNACGSSPNAGSPDKPACKQLASAQAELITVKNARDVAAGGRDKENDMVGELNNGFNDVNNSVGTLKFTASSFQFTESERNTLSKQSSERNRFSHRYNGLGGNVVIPPDTAGLAEGISKDVSATEAMLADIRSTYFDKGELVLKLPLADRQRIGGLIDQADLELDEARGSLSLARQDELLKRSDALNMTDAGEALAKSLVTVGKVLTNLDELEKEAPERIVPTNAAK